LAPVLHELTQARPQLSFIDLLAIGIGGTIGSGVFVLTGDVQPVAGPSAVLSWLLAGGTCLLSGLSYMELSARIPARGSCYIFAYTTLGELAGVVGGVCLTMEYGLSGAGVARSWSDKLAALVHSNLDTEVSSQISLDWAATALQIMCVSVCLMKLELGKKVINTLTILKVTLVIFLILAGLVPAMLYGAPNYPNVFLDYDTFFPQGIGGTITGASLLFFGFIGFDEVCCLASRAENPSVVMPRAIAGTLFGAALMSSLAQLSLSYLIDYDTSGDDGQSFEDAFDAHGWTTAR
jgi:basic amino acid/polyamine antiporter, APA family